MNIALILSGGRGTRTGSRIPKQYIEICGKPVIAYCLETIIAHPMIDHIQIVCEKNREEYISDKFKSEKIKGFSAAGKNRQSSIYNGLSDIIGYAGENDYVLIHDAARPMVSRRMITECLEAAHKNDGAVPVLQMKDTVYLSENGQVISSLIDRKKVFAGQAPEAFILGKYLEANKRLLPDKILEINGSTEPAVMAGMDIAMIKGDEKNFKITTGEDLERFESICSSRNRRSTV